MNSSVESIDRDARETGRRETFDAIDVDRRGSRVSRVRLLARRRQTNACINPIASIHSTRVRACIRARDGRGRRCIHTVIPYILTRNTRVFDSYHHRPCMFSKTCMRDRFVPRIETQYVRTHAAVVWFGRHTRHDTHTHIVLYFTLIRIYCPRSTPYTTYKRARPRHAVNQSMHGAHSSTRRRARDWRRASDDDVGERTNERVRRRLRFRRNGTRPRVIHARIIGVGKIHWPRETEKSTREEFIHSFTHSFGSVTRGTEP